MVTYDTVILLSWAAFLVVWGVGAFNVKRDVTGRFAELEQARPLLRLGIAIVVVIALVVRTVVWATSDHSGRGLSYLESSVFVPPDAAGWAAAALVGLGIGFAIWARVHLGRNWSSSPAMKVGHELVTGGPYRYVRHPIYAGIMLAALGSALSGSIIGIATLVLTSAVFASRLGREEQIMLELFPDQYPAYQATTKRLVPFLW